MTDTSYEAFSVRFEESKVEEWCISLFRASLFLLQSSLISRQCHRSCAWYVSIP